MKLTRVHSGLVSSHVGAQIRSHGLDHITTPPLQPTHPAMRDSPCTKCSRAYVSGEAPPWHRGNRVGTGTTAENVSLARTVRDSAPPIPTWI